MSAQNKYWYNLDTAEVELGQMSPGNMLVGPFDSLDEASRAPQLLRERAQAWAEEEEAAERGWGGAGGSASRGR